MSHGRFEMCVVAGKVQNGRAARGRFVNLPGSRQSLSGMLDQLPARRLGFEAAYGHRGEAVSYSWGSHVRPSAARTMVTAYAWSTSTGVVKDSPRRQLAGASG